jgi:hypothetical protein
MVFCFPLVKNRFATKVQRHKKEFFCRFHFLFQQKKAPQKLQGWLFFTELSGRVSSENKLILEIKINLTRCIEAYTWLIFFVNSSL